MTDYVKIDGVWHIKDADKYVRNKVLVTLHCNGGNALKGRPESSGAPGDNDPVCQDCLNNPLPDEIKKKVSSSRDEK